MQQQQGGGETKNEAADLDLDLELRRVSSSSSFVAALAHLAHLAPALHLAVERLPMSARQWPNLAPYLSALCPRCLLP